MDTFPECLPTKTDLSFTAVTKAVQHKCWSTVKFRSTESGKGESDKRGESVRKRSRRIYNGLSLTQICFFYRSLYNLFCKFLTKGKYMQNEIGAPHPFLMYLLNFYQCGLQT